MNKLIYGVEDDKIMSKIIKCVAEEYGYTVRIFSDCESALADFIVRREKDEEVVGMIVDNKLQGTMSGREFCDIMLTEQKFKGYIAMLTGEVPEKERISINKKNENYFVHSKSHNPDDRDSKVNDIVVGIQRHYNNKKNNILNDTYLETPEVACYRDGRIETLDDLIKLEPQQRLMMMKLVQDMGYPVPRSCLAEYLGLSKDNTLTQAKVSLETALKPLGGIFTISPIRVSKKNGRDEGAYQLDMT